MELFYKKVIELIPSFDGGRCAEKSCDIVIYEMETALKKGDVRLRFVAEKAGTPDPWDIWMSLLWHNDDGLDAVEGEIVAVKSVECGLGDRLRQVGWDVLGDGGGGEDGGGHEKCQDFVHGLMMVD